MFFCCLISNNSTINTYTYIQYMLYLHLSSTCSGGENSEVAELKKTKGQLNVRGDVSMSDLTTGVEYEVVFMVRLKKGGCGWEHPVTVILSVPGVGDKRRRVNLYEQPRDEWFDLKVGDFTPESAGTGQVVSFHLLQEGEHEKKGLLLQSAVVKPKSPYHALYGLV